MLNFELKCMNNAGDMKVMWRRREARSGQERVVVVPWSWCCRLHDWIWLNKGIRLVNAVTNPHRRRGAGALNLRRSGQGDD